MESPIADEEIIELTRELLRAPSVNPPADTEACARVALAYLEQNGVPAELREGAAGVFNVVGRLSGERPGKRLLLNGHIDVVAPGEGWSVDPFGGEIRAGQIYGRGACDMKSGIAAMLAAVVGFKRSRKSFKGEIIVAAVGDEETGSRFGTRYLLERGLKNEIDLAIVTEPTDLAIELGNRGLRWFDVTVKGQACHAGRPHYGRNAVHGASLLIQAIHDHKFSKRDAHFEIPTPSMSVTMINAGTQVNVIPNRCRFSIDRRMIPGETSGSVLAELREIVDSVLARQEGFEVDIEMRPDWWDPYLIAEDEPIVAALKSAHFEVTRREPIVRTKLACTDASHIFHQAGIPVVLYGPGIAGRSHQVDECVPVEDLVQATNVLLKVIDKILT
jgi:acetylornithine deacetylase/succinyl-diaminopimelate desuccinylase family protein